MDKLLQPGGRLPDAKTPATGALFRSETRKDHREVRRHARADGFPDIVHVVATGAAQTSLHSVDGRPLSGGDVGAGNRAAQGHLAHIFRHDGVRAEGQRELQAGGERAHR